MLTAKRRSRRTPRLRECDYGTLTKKPSAEIAYGEHIDRPFPRGESLREVEARMREFLREAKRHNYQRIAIVSHRAPQLALEVIVSKTTWEHAIMNDWRISGRWQPGWKYIDD